MAVKIGFSSVFWGKKWQILLAALLSAQLSFAQCITSFPYNNDFETNTTGWSTGGTLSDWAWGAPVKSVITKAASGTKCWITGGLNKTAYNDGELAWLQSPCFNFSGIPHPYVSFMVFWETERNFDGAVMEYSIDNGASWVRAGSINDPVNCLNGNWFNTATVKYANNGNGWSGSVLGGGGACLAGGGSAKWVLANHTFPALAGRPNVRFRFLFGAGTSCNAYNGFAIDDFHVGEAPPNQAGFNFTCSNGNTVSFTNSSAGCPTYLWNFGDPASGASNTSTQTHPSHTYSSPGTFTVSLTASGPGNAPSTVTKTVTILDLNTQVLSAPLCNGDKNGSAKVTASPNIAGLMYTWNTSPVQNNPTISNLGAGTYVVTVSGTGVCTTQDNITITEPQKISNTVSLTQPGCQNNDGSITLSSTGGVAPYTYTWSPNSSTGNSATGLGTGTYSIIVKDGNNCTTTEQVVLNSGTALTANVLSKQDITCYGNKNGSITIGVNGGFPPYDFSWAPYGGNQQTASFLGPGTYTLTIKDQKGCILTASASITEPAQLASSISKTDAVCNNNNGTAAALITGGVLPYTYSWAPGGFSNASISNLAPNTYYLTVTDNNGCKVSDAVTIANAAGVLNLQMSNTAAVCHGTSTGTATVTASGGIAPYTYQWNNGQTSSNISNLLPGTYTVLVKDAAGCTATASTVITEPPGMTITMQTTDASCNNGLGSVSTIITGGTPAYSYSWTPAAANTAGIAAPAGTYSVTVTDAKGCQATNSASIVAPNAISFEVGTQAVTCGAKNGAAFFTTHPSGGNGVLTSTWNPGNKTGNRIDNLDTGQYSVTVSDATGCGLTKAFQVTTHHEGAVTLMLNNTNVTCFGSNTGTATAIASGGHDVMAGNTGYTYTWSNGAMGSGISNLPAGTYTVVAKSNSSGCTQTGSVNITQSPAINLAISVTDPVCFGATGTISSTVSGGLAPYTYAWNPGGSTTNMITAVAGNYTLTVTDKNGCKTEGNGTVKEPAAISFQVGTTPATCGVNNGTAFFAANPAGGTGALTYTWHPSNITANRIDSQAVGNYSVTVKDAAGCILAKPFQIITNHQGAVTLSVNSSNISCFGSNSGTATAIASGGHDVTAGNTGYTYTWSNGATGSGINNLAAGTYTVIAKSNSSGCTQTGSVTVSQPPAISISTTATHPACFGGNGSIASIVTGGAGSNSYLWTPGNLTTAGINNIKAGTYQLTVTDKNGCTQTKQTIVTAPAALSSSMQVVQPDCSSSVGSASIQVTGGTTPYSYSWSPATASGNTATNLAAGTYTVAVTDNNGCKTQNSAVIQSFNSIVVQTSKTDVLCNGQNTGTASVAISGGQSPYQILWSNGATTAAIGNIAAGSYSVTIKDAGNCTITKTLDIVQPAKINLQLSATAAVCTSASGSIASTATGGTGTLQYLWQPGGVTQPQLQNVTAGNYSLRVTDANGCTANASAVVAATNPLSVSLGADTALCLASGEKLTLQPGNFSTYLWQDGSRGAGFNVVKEGWYFVTVVNAQGCTASDSIFVKNDCGEIYFPSAFTPNTDGKNDQFGPLGNLSALTDFELVVYNRWGQRVFASNNPFIKWNGRTGNDILSGTYVWYARYSSRYGNHQMQKGTVILVR